MRWTIGFALTIVSIPMWFLAKPHVAPDWHSGVASLAIGCMVAGAYQMGRRHNA